MGKRAREAVCLRMQSSCSESSCSTLALIGRARPSRTSPRSNARQQNGGERNADRLDAPIVVLANLIVKEGDLSLGDSTHVSFIAMAHLESRQTVACTCRCPIEGRIDAGCGWWPTPLHGSDEVASCFYGAGFWEMSCRTESRQNSPDTESVDVA
mmetsp:Transcript_4990/g.13785  ORF Transcript_4990/g.13785 Transcript_4990/m.13785 type:complete len:155 (-) Transcript_4990:17-481(-)